MTSIDWWNVLLDDARNHGPEAVKLVLQVGETRFNALLSGRFSRSYNNFLDGKPPEESTGLGMYESYEADLKAVLVLRPDRLHFPSERKDPDA
ncbi:MAG TPA: hypothetical protein VIJ94_05010 [Caulobacteraceae bacterium]